LRLIRVGLALANISLEKILATDGMSGVRDTLTEFE